MIQIVGYTARLQEELDRVREEKKSFKQERDQFPKFLGVTERAMKEVEAELKNEQIGIEEDKRRHQEETQVRLRRECFTAGWIFLSIINFV